MYGIDFDFFAEIHQERSKSPWPKSFLFVGRYTEVKGIGTLMQAYRQYRQSCNGEPWPLVCCGKGPMEGLIEAEEGVINRGFVQPDEMRDIWKEAGCFLLPSRFDPWPLVIVEACAAGLPVICTDVCGSSVELIREQYNGITLAANNVDQLCQALLNIHQKDTTELQQWGSRSAMLAQPYAAQYWAERWLTILKL
jgi:glycosyltransferase involved in cell wall biosynthesis